MSAKFLKRIIQAKKIADEKVTVESYIIWVRDYFLPALEDQGLTIKRNLKKVPTLSDHPLIEGYIIKEED